jgi:hypothetical protein
MPVLAGAGAQKRQTIASVGRGVSIEQFRPSRPYRPACLPELSSSRREIRALQNFKTFHISDPKILRSTSVNGQK